MPVYKPSCIRKCGRLTYSKWGVCETCLTGPCKDCGQTFTARDPAQPRCKACSITHKRRLKGAS